MDPAQVQQLIQGVGVSIGEQLNSGLRQQAQSLAAALARENQTTILTTKPKSFSGKYEDWPVWSMRLMSSVRKMGYELYLVQAENEQPEDLTIATMTDPTKAAAVIVYDMLLDILENRAHVILKSCEKGNGFQVWCKLKREYEGKLAGRFSGMLTAIMNPGWCDEKGVLKDIRVRPLQTCILNGMQVW